MSTVLDLLRGVARRTYYSIGYVGTSSSSSHSRPFQCGISPAAPRAATAVDPSAVLLPRTEWPKLKQGKPRREGGHSRFGHSMSLLFQSHLSLCLASCRTINRHTFANPANEQHVPLSNKEAYIQNSAKNSSHPASIDMSMSTHRETSPSIETSTQNNSTRPPPPTPVPLLHGSSNGTPLAAARAKQKFAYVDPKTAFNPPRRNQPPSPFCTAVAMEHPQT